jgi:serine/threonine protein phosphatase PrpC
MVGYRLNSLENYSRGTSGLRHNRDSNQSTDLHRLLRMQNQVIIGLSLCLALVVLSTVVLIQHLPRQNDRHARFWEQTEDLLQTQRQQPQLRQQRNVVKGKCSYFGCFIRPVEISQLGGTSSHTTAIASSSHILLTHQGNREAVNQDRAVLIPSFKYVNNDDLPLDEMQLSGVDFFAGVFDGHDNTGDDISQFASEQIPSRIASKIKQKYDSQSNNFTVIKEIIKESFLEVDNNAPGADEGGCTASVVMRIGKKLFMANTGDSTAFIVIYTPPRRFDKKKAKENEEYVNSERNARFELDLELNLQGKISIFHQNTRHKPHITEERLRIESMGGRIHIPRDKPTDSKVVRQNELGYIGLGVSRSIGNHKWTSVGVIPDPDIFSLNLIKFWSENNIVNGGRSSDSSGGKKVFVVLGSDGLFDARREEYVASHLAYGLFEDPRLLLDVGKKLINMAAPLKKEWYRPDITFLAKVIEL